MSWLRSEHPQFKREVVGVYDRAAPIYDRVGARFFSHFGQQLVGRTSIFEGAYVLDVATGRGAILFPVARQLGATGRVIGIDLAPTMVKHTAAEADQQGLGNTNVLLMDADQIGFADQSFDYVFCGSALFFLDYEQALLDFKRVLKPGGCFATWISIPSDDAQDSQRWQWLSELTRSVFPAEFTPPLSWVASRRLNRPGLLEGAFQNAGFIDVQITQESTELLFVDENDWWDWEWSQAPRFILEAMNAEMLEKFKTLSMAGVKAMQEADGIHSQFSALLATGYKPI